MNVTYRPYRLINDHELKTLLQNFTERLSDWNKIYALFPLSCHLERHSQATHQDKWHVVSTEPEQPIALLTEQDMSVLKNCLFGDESDCFNAVAETLLITLLNRLLGTASLTVESHATPISLEEWFYTGAPSLSLILSGAGQSMTCFLHPEWVLKALPKSPPVLKPTSTLQDALTSQALHWEVELNPVLLPLKDLLHLQVGDVIKTDHPVLTPLQLKIHQQPIGHVTIGETNSYKSIQITSAL